MINTLQHIILLFLCSSINTIDGQYCVSAGSSTEFEYIQSVQIDDTFFDSGDNGGYHFSNSEPISFSKNSKYAFVLTPGHTDVPYEEVWSIWIDYNHDQTFSDSELVTQVKSEQVIQTDILVEAEDFVEGETMMRIAMRYNVASAPCEAFLNGEVEDYLVLLTEKTCKDYHHQDFAAQYGGWQDGGTDCALSQDHVSAGDHCVRLRDNSGNGSSLTSPVLQYEEGKNTVISFSYYANSMESGEQLIIELYDEHTQETKSLSSLTSGLDMILNKWSHQELQFEVNSSTQRLRFRCDASDNGDQVYIDDVTISHCQKTEIDQDLGHIILSGQELQSKQEGSTVFFTDIEVSFYPSPTSQNLSVSIDKKYTNQGNLSYAIMDMNGTLMVSHNAQAVEAQGGIIDVRHLPNGIYNILTINLGRIIDRKKIVILH